jgi:hypothetical protein
MLTEVLEQFAASIRKETTVASSKIDNTSTELSRIWPFPFRRLPGFNLLIPT